MRRTTPVASTVQGVAGGVKQHQAGDGPESKRTLNLTTDVPGDGEAVPRAHRQYERGPSSLQSSSVRSGLGTRGC